VKKKLITLNWKFLHSSHFALKQRLWEFYSPWIQLPDLSANIGKTELEKKINRTQFIKTQQVSLLTWHATLAGVV
jgi:hypothetical protein